MRRNIEQELQEARLKARHIAGTLHELGIEHKDIDVERAGMLAFVETPDGIHLGDMISLGDLRKDALLRAIRHILAKSVARTALGVKDRGHFNSIQEIIPPGQSVANWMAEIWFDGDKSRYALIGEYLQAIAASPGWRRAYSVYQAKIESRCDVLGCQAHWYERKTTSHGYCVHVCRKHKKEDADVVFRKITPSSHVQEEVRAHGTSR